jgi:hypothetical protein
MITSFYFSAGCFSVGFILTAIVSFSGLFKYCNKSAAKNNNQPELY